MTTSDETVKLIVFLVHLGVIGAECSAGAGETKRDHEGFECPREIQDYMSWETAMRTSDSVWVDRTYYQLRRVITYGLEVAIVGGSLLLPMHRLSELSMLGNSG